MIEDDIKHIKERLTWIQIQLDKLLAHIIPKPKAENKELKAKAEKALKKKGQTFEERIAHSRKKDFI